MASSLQKDAAISSFNESSVNTPCNSLSLGLNPISIAKPWWGFILLNGTVTTLLEASEARVSGQPQTEVLIGQMATQVEGVGGNWGCRPTRQEDFEFEKNLNRKEDF